MRSLVQLGKRFKAERYRQKLTQDKLAWMAGVPVTTLRRVEAGLPTMSSSLLKMAEALGIQITLRKIDP